MAVVECDGGRIRTREPGQGPGVHRTAEGWRETKNACLIRAARTASEEDPQPEPPECFSDPKHVAKIAETEALSVAAALPADPATEQDSSESAGLVPPDDWHPKRLVRTVLASIAGSKEFGEQMAREAKRRRFAEAAAKAFLGDGLAWNWSIWKRHFAEFTPILDFIHVLSYLFLAAKAVHESAADAWDQYLAWMRGAWRGEAEQVLEELRAWRPGWASLLRARPRAIADDPRQDDHVSGEQPGSDEVPGVSSCGPAGDDGVDGVAGQGDELSGQGDGDVLERPRRSGGDPPGTGGGTCR